MTIFLVTYGDRDYYCENSHIAGAFSTRELAQQAIDGSTLQSWSKLTYAIREIELDAPMELE